jgi:hypothetical protein
METRRLFILLATLALTVIGLGLLLGGVSADPSGTVSGIVVDEDGPVPGATVRIQATTNSTLTALDGTFTLDGLVEGVPVTVSAWKNEYYCAKVEGVTPPISGVTLTLRLYQTNDNPDYEWIPPTGDNSCYSCKPGVTQIWLDNDAHGRSGTNPRFLSLYTGTDITGTTVISPGYKLDFPSTTGNCATCHAPGAAVDAPFTTDMSLLSGVDRDFGVHCDFCHKVAGMYLNPATGLPYPNAPGVLSMDIRRPFPESERYQLFFGTFDDDNVPQEDTHLPLIAKSQWCATCHQFSFWGIPIYQSFKEWQESPYPQSGIECQTCHMPAPSILNGQVLTNVAPSLGGVERDPQTIHAHTMPGAANAELLQNTVAMTVAAYQVANTVQVSVTLTNVAAGHHVPTDFPGRHMILAVAATDGQGQALPLQSGPTVPEWGGAQAGQPGKAFAKVLRDVKTGESPVVSYWKQTLIVSDNRIPALGSDTSAYTFAVPADGGEVNVTARLLFRRAFQPLTEAKGWEVEDIVMETEVVTLSLGPAYRIYLPVIMKS